MHKGCATKMLSFWLHIFNYDGRNGSKSSRASLDDGEGSVSFHCDPFSAINVDYRDKRRALVRARAYVTRR